MINFVIVVFFATALAAPQTFSNLQKAKACDSEACLLPNCKCASTEPPKNLPLEQIPQFVFLTFDDAVTAANYETYANIFYGRRNPDGCPIASTYYMSHEYTDYSKVHDLYLNGHEIALHSISHSPQTSYWKNLTINELHQEFGDEKTLAAHWAKIPEEAIKGMRVPFLQLSGSNSYKVAKDIGLNYDCSWPTQNYRKPALWPYTLDYLSDQDCPIGPCPEDSIPGMWVVPMVDWQDQNGIVCSMVDACVNIPTDVDEVLEWYIENFNRHYKVNKAPFGFYVHAAWFSVDPSHLPAYRKFVDYLLSLPDVYIVSATTAINWIKNPIPVGSSDWPSCSEPQDLGCNPQVCVLQKGTELRYMTVCADTCPKVYPWLGNPLGVET